MQKISGISPVFFTLLALFTTYAQDTISSSNPDTLADSANINLPLQFINNTTPVFKSGEAVLIQILPDSSSFLNGVYKIDEKGCIDFPIIGVLQVINMSEMQLIDTIKLRCIDYLPFPNIRISSLMRVSLLGGFFKPGLYWIDSRNSVWDAIRMAGGVQREDGVKLLRWERDGKVLSKNLIDFFQSGVSLQSVGFQSGDQISVTSRPKSQFSFREHVLPFFSLFLTTLTTGITIYSLTQEK